jgi:tetratricopeptide (TPR) repeat protein
MMRNLKEIMMLSCLALMGCWAAAYARMGEPQRPTSQLDYWRWVFHADSLMEQGRLDEAEVCYDCAFAVERYILPSSLLTTARRMSAAGRQAAALRYIRLRVHMEPDFYLESETEFPSLADTFRLRAARYGYDVQMKQRLERLMERDQYDRALWRLASMDRRADSICVQRLARRAAETDRANLAEVTALLQRQGFPSRRQVGGFAVQAVWLVFQHSDLEHQKTFLPQLRQAVARGDIPPAYLAVLIDRIDVREGKPQRYGSQYGPDGQLCPLLDSLRVNEWRKEVGLPPLKR